MKIAKENKAYIERKWCFSCKYEKNCYVKRHFIEFDSVWIRNVIPDILPKFKAGKDISVSSAASKGIFESELVSLLGHFCDIFEYREAKDGK